MVAGIPFSGTVLKLGLAGIIVVGAVKAADHFNVGTAFAQGANEIGKAGGSLITESVVGLTESLTDGIEKIRLNTQELFSGLNVAGADFQEAFTGNRDAIGDFFAGEQRQDKRYNGIISDPISAIPTGIIPDFFPDAFADDNTPSTSRPKSRQDEINSINKILNPNLRVTGVSEPLGTLKNLLSVRGTPLAQRAISRTEPTLSGTITTKAGGTRDIRGSAALFERLNKNLNR